MQMQHQNILPSFNRQPVTMSDKAFNRLSRFIYAQCGIKLTPAKKTMLSARLFKRMRALGIGSMDTYYEYVNSPEGRREELSAMIDAVSTNKTEFFREAAHFDFLLKAALPSLLRLKAQRGRRTFNIWSAGCSSGEEPYTLAMVLSEFVDRNQGCDFSINATDISVQMLAAAKKAIYPEPAVNPVPIDFKRKYLMRGKESRNGFYRIVPELRRRVTFNRLNLMDKDFNLGTPMDIIFCRNVIIYFDRSTQIELFNKFYHQLVPGGYLFVGHSESLNGITDKFNFLSNTTYIKPR